jgi:hypothetical protein
MYLKCRCIDARLKGFASVSERGDEGADTGGLPTRTCIHDTAVHSSRGKRRTHELELSIGPNTVQAFQYLQGCACLSK